MGEEGNGGEVGEEPVLFCDWEFILHGRVIGLGGTGARAEVKVCVEAGAENGTGRGGKGKGGRTGVACACVCADWDCCACLPNPVRLGGPQPETFPLVRSCAAEK